MSNPLILRRIGDEVLRLVQILVLCALLPLSTTQALAQKRTFSAGFTAFPYDKTQAALDYTWHFINLFGEHVSLHIDDGVPWYPAALGTPFPRAFEADLQLQLAKIPAGRTKILNVTPISTTRDAIAPNKTEAGIEPLDGFWSAQHFDSPYVKRAFFNYCVRMIDKVRPNIFAYSIESNVLHKLSPRKWAAYVRLMNYVYVALKKRYPRLPVVNTIQVETYHVSPAAQDLVLKQIMFFTDWVAVSVYPYLLHADPRKIPTNYFKTIAAYGAGRKFMVSETGWPSEPITAPYPLSIAGTQTSQKIYVTRLWSEAQALQAVALNWFLVRDLDTLWTRELQYSPDAALVRSLKDIGLVDDRTNTSKNALNEWLTLRFIHPR